MPAPIKIAVNTRLLLADKMDGIGYFTQETVRRMVAWHPDIEFHFLFDRPWDPSFVFGSNVVPVALFPQARHPFLWYWWFEWSVARYLKSQHFDLFLSPDGYVSLRAETPTVAVQHDIAFEHLPDQVNALTSMYYRYFVPKFISRSSRLATVSEYSKADIISHYGTAADKIDVVYSAAKEIFGPIDDAAQEKIRDAYSAGCPYLLYVGTIHPRKNLKNMLLAFDAFKKLHESNLKFVIAGAMGWQNSELKEIVAGMTHSDALIFTGRMPVQQLADLIASAWAVMYVSLFEGFGVPPLEAMQSGVPVITSNVTSMPEICGDAALLASPTDPSSIADAITTLWREPYVREQLIRKGHERCMQYTWDRTAYLLWGSCEKVLGAKYKA